MLSFCGLTESSGSHQGGVTAVLRQLDLDEVTAVIPRRYVVQMTVGNVRCHLMQTGLS